MVYRTYELPVHDRKAELNPSAKHPPSRFAWCRSKVFSLMGWFILWAFIIFCYNSSLWIKDAPANKVVSNGITLPVNDNVTFDGKDTFPVVWVASVQKYGKMAEGLANEAIDFLVPLSKLVHLGWVNQRNINPIDSSDSSLKDLKPTDQKILAEIYQEGRRFLDIKEDHVVVLQVAPPNFNDYLVRDYDFKKFKYKIGRCMHETDALPEGWSNVINRDLDEVWVTSRFAKMVFLKEGVTIPVSVIREGFDPEVFTRKKAVIDKDHFFGKCASDFVFIAVSTWIDRKGWDILVEAFTEEFSKSDAVCLAIRSTETAREFDELPNPRHSKIVKVDGIPNDRLPSFFASADGFVLPTHGEGWGRTVMEAMAMGLPVIVTRWSGLSEFVNPAYSVPINITSAEPVFPKNMYYLGDDFRKGNRHKWAHVDKYALRGAMRWIYEHQDEARIIGKRAEAFMHTNYTRGVIAEDVRHRLFQIFAKKFGYHRPRHGETDNLA